MATSEMGKDFPLPSGVKMMARIANKSGDMGYPRVHLAIDRDGVRRIPEGCHFHWEDGCVTETDGALDDIVGDTITILDGIGIGIALFVWESERHPIDMAEGGEFLTALRALRHLD
jgi:hypothetical protein